MLDRCGLPLRLSVLKDGEIFFNYIPCMCSAVDSISFVCLAIETIVSEFLLPEIWSMWSGVLHPEDTENEWTSLVLTLLPQRKPQLYESQNGSYLFSCPTALTCKFWRSATSRTPQRHAAYGVTDYMDQAIMKDFRKSMEITYWVIACNRIYTNNLLYCNVFVWEVSIRPFLHHLGVDQNWIEESQNTKLNQYMIFLPQWVAWTYAAVQSCMSIAYILLTNVEAGFITSCVFFLHSCCFDIHCLHWCFSTRKRIQISLDLARGRSRRGILPGTIRNALSWA